MQVSVILQHAGLAVAPVQSTEDLWRDPQLRARGAFVEIDHPDIGLLEQPQSPDRMTLTPGHVAREVTPSGRRHLRCAAGLAWTARNRPAGSPIDRGDLPGA